MNNDKHNLHCDNADAFVSYLYNEMPAAQRTVLENHLLDCQLCMDEFAEISEARFSVYEWRRVEFEALDTPRIVVPYESAAGISWFGKLKEAFSLSPVWATAGASFAVVAVIFGIVMFSGLLEGGTEIATAVKSNAEQPAPAPVAAPARIEPEIETVSENPAVSKDKRAVEPKRAVPVKVSEPVKRKPRRTLRPTPDVRPETAFQRPPQAAPLPTFTEYAEQEDESLRLAELFDDIETSD